MSEKYWFGLEHYVEKLLREGKRRSDPEFQHLFSAFKDGERKVELLVKKIRERKKTESAKPG